MFQNSNFVKLRFKEKRNGKHDLDDNNRKVHAFFRINQFLVDKIQYLVVWG